MAVYNEKGVENQIYALYDRVRTWVSTSLGVLLALTGIGVIFMIASLEGTREIKATNREAINLLESWRIDNNDPSGFPEEKGEFIEYKNREYYFVIEERHPDTGDIMEWYFAYDGGLEYVFMDSKFYILTALTIAISLYVAHVNYISTIRSFMQTETFAKTLTYYQKRKEKIENYTQYIPEFCAYKVKQALDIKTKEIVEKAGLRYSLYKSGELGVVEDWQQKELDKIKKIRIKKIYSSDLLQETGSSVGRIMFLPMSQREHHAKFMYMGFVQKMIMSTLSGLVVAFGVVLGNWFLGISYGTVILISYISSVIISADFAATTLRNRYIAKADLLNEFDNIKEKFIGGENDGNQRRVDDGNSQQNDTDGFGRN